MMIELIALDLDGTTLRKDRFTVSRRNQHAIRAAQDQGILVVPATGRFYNGIPPSVKGLCGRYAITSNGARITDRHSGELYSNLIPADRVLEVLALSKPYSVYTQVYCDGIAYSGRGKMPAFIRNNPVLLLLSLFKWLKYERVGDLAEFVRRSGKPVEKIELVPDNPEIQRELKEKLYGYELSVSTSGMNTVEITSAGANKGTALAYLCNRLHIRPENVMAIGDNVNDREMLEWAGLAVAIGNADPALKEIADYVTERYDRDGVAQAIRRFALKLPDESGSL
jgi:Cof subfamily protein (haloacid dehalogenase superfamily)